MAIEQQRTRSEGSKKKETNILQPEIAFGGITLQDSVLHLSLKNGSIHERDVRQGTVEDALAFFRQKAKETKTVVTAVGISGANGQERELRTRIWTELDAVPVHDDESRDPSHMAELLAEEFTHDGLPKVKLDPRTKEVIPSQLVSWGEFQRTTTPENNALIPFFVEQLGSEPTIEISATPQGGGVSIMNHDRMRANRAYNEAAPKEAKKIQDLWLPMNLGLDPEVCQELGVDPKTNWAEMTKKEHNINQDALDKSLPESKRRLTAHDKKVYKALTLTQVKHLGDALKVPGATYILHDFQPSGLAAEIKKLNPTAKIIVRVHIALRPDLIAQEGSPQQDAWRFWKSQMIDAEGNYLVDAVEFHPSREGKIEEFIPRGEDALDPNLVVLRPATTSPIDGLNKELSAEQQDRYMGMFNTHLEEQGQTSLDLSRRYDVQLARFDESKNIIGAILSYLEYRKLERAVGTPDEKIMQRVIGGHGALDDPSGSKIYNAIGQYFGFVPVEGDREKEIIPAKENDFYQLMQRKTKGKDAVITPEDYELLQEVKQDLKFARLPHSDQLLNAVAQGAYAGLQLSHEEGCEVKISELKKKNKPMQVANRGGMTRQVKNGVSAFIVEPDDYKTIGKNTFDLNHNAKLYADMSDPVKAQPEYSDELRKVLGSADSEYFTQADMRDWLGLQLMIRDGIYKPLVEKMRNRLGRQPFVKELIDEQYGWVTKEQNERPSAPQSGVIFAAH